MANCADSLLDEAAGCLADSLLGTELRSSASLEVDRYLFEIGGMADAISESCSTISPWENVAESEDLKAGMCWRLSGRSYEEGSLSARV
jgi:hypothetical protein